MSERRPPGVPLDMYGNSPMPATQTLRRKHLIARVHWRRGIKPEEYDGAPIECVCGWAGTVGQWWYHRTETPLPLGAG